MVSSARFQGPGHRNREGARGDDEKRESVVVGQGMSPTLKQRSHPLEHRDDGSGTVVRRS